jgi:hypothetical protein
MSFTKYNYILQEIQDYKKISTISYNKLGHTTRNFSPDSKTKKEILI